MIYELAIVAKTEATEEQRAAINTMVAEVTAEFKGEVLLTDDWGNKHFAQSTSKGVKTGHYLYLVISGNGDALLEIERRLKINELVLKKMFIKVGDTKEEGEKFIEGVAKSTFKNGNFNTKI